MTITDNVIEDEVVSSAEKDVARIRRKSGEDFRLLFQEGKDEIELDKINKFFNEADQPFIEQFVHDVNQGVQNHFNQGEEDVQNRNHWKRALPILENFKKHQAKRGAKRDFGVLEGIRNTEINSNWRDRKKSYYLPVFKGEKPVDGVEDKYQDRAMNAMFIAEANELDLEQVNGSYELYRAQLWAGYKLEGKPNDKGLRERIKQDLVKEDDRQNFIKEIANDAHNSAMLGMPMNWTGRQEFTFDDSDYEKYGVSKDHAKKIFRSVARNSVRDFKVAAPYGVKLADAISKRMGVDLKYDNNSDKSSDSLDVLISEIATLPKEERGRVLYVASKVAEKEGISTDSYLESLGLTMKRHFQDYPNTVVAGFVKKTGDDPDEDANTFAKIEKLKEEHFEKFGYDFIEKNKDKPANDKEVQAYFKSQDKFRKAESALTSANRRELWHDIRDVRNTIRKVELQYEEGLMRDVQQGTLDATSSILPMAAIALPFGLGYGTNALYYSEEDDHLMRHEYPEMDANTREVIAGFSGSAKTLTNRIAVGKIFSKAPFTASLMKKIGARGAIASLLGRGLKGGAWEYTEERLQEAILPLAHEIGAALSKDIPELKEDSWDKVIYGTNEDGSLREKTKLNAIYHPRIFFAVLPLVTLASGGSTVIDKMGADKFRKSLSSEDQLMLVGLTLEEAQVIQGMNESGSINVHTEFQKMMQDKTPEQKKEAIKAAEDSGALDRVRESEVMDNGTDAEKKAFSEAKQAFEKLTEIQKRVNGEVRTMDDGRVEVVFPESLNKVNEYYDNTDQAQEAYISAIEDHDAQQSAEIKSTQGSIEELRGRGIKDASDAKKAVAGFLGKAHEGAENQFVDSDYGMQQKLDKAEIDFEEAMDALKVANMHNKSGVPITLQNAMIKGENVHKKNARGYINKLYRGADVSTVFHESAEGYLKSLIENDGYTYKWFADQMADYQRATGDIIFADIDNFTNREVIEGWSKLSEAHVYNNMESSSFPPFIRAILNAFKKYFAHTVDTAKNLLQLKQDGKLDGDFESHLDKAVGLDSESIKGNKQKQYEREIVEEILDASGDFVPVDTPDPKPKARVSPADVAAHRKAEASGDTETAQKLVDEAAKKSKHILPVFRGDTLGKNTFERSIGTMARRGSGIYTAETSHGDPKYFGRMGAASFVNKKKGQGIYKLYAKTSNPLEINKNLKDGESTAFTQKAIKDGYDSTVSYKYLLPKNPDTTLLEKKQEEIGDTASIEAVLEHIKLIEYEGTVDALGEDIANSLFDKVVDQRAFFDSSQLKSADPFTYDGDGNLIPLDQRFNESKDEISFSISPADATPFSIGDTSFSVDYMRVLPRDFFNEAKVYSMHTKLVEDFNNGKLPKGFDIEVIDENDKIGLSDDGELYFNGIEITFDGEPLQFNTTYNAGKTAKYPLSVTAEGMDIWSVPVYDQDGNLDEEFTDAFGEELGDSNDVMLDGTMEVNRDFLVQMGRLGLLYVAGMLSNDFKLDLVDLEAGMQLEEDGNSVYSTNIESSIKGEPIEFNKSFNGELRYDHNGESGNVFDGSGLSDDFSKIVSRNGDTSFSIRPLSPRELTTQVTSLENTFRSYDEVQNEIDSVEDELELQGVDTSKMYNPSDPEAETIRGTLPDYQPMPDRLAKLYEERESIGATEFETGREALSSNLASLGLTVGEVRKVLQYYSVDPDKSGAVEQSMSASSTMGTIRKKTQEQQAEEIAYTLANARNESFDGLRDISKKTLKDAAKVVQLTKQFLDPETSPVAPEVTLAREPKADTSGDTSFSISPAQVEAEILDTLPDDTYLTRFGGGVGRSSVNIDEVTLYKGEDSPPKIKKATLDGGDSSMISNSTYPIIRLDMSNGSYFKQQIRISDHAQVSKNAPKNYDYDYRGKNWTAVKSSVLEDMEVLSSEIWDAQKTILTTEKSVRDNDRELQDKKGSQAAQVRQKTELERLISNLESVSNPSRSEKLEKAIERGDKIAEAGHRNAISKNNLRIKESKEKLIQLADIEASGDTSFSISPADVTAHSKAYEDGDTDTAQRLVDAAAKAAGYEVDAYHVTDEKFDVFDPYESAMGGVFWFTENKSKIEDGGTGAGLNPTKEQLTLHVYLKANKQAGWDEYDKLGLGEIEAKGFDSVKLDDDYIVFNSSQIKLADPFTYDANGDLIPLSERFNESKDEISFSVSPADVIFNPDKTSELQALKILETEILKYKVYEVSDNTESQKETVLVTTDLNKAYDELEDIGFKNEFDTRELMSSVVYDSKKAASDLYSEFKDFGSDITREDIYNEIEDQEIDLDFEKVIENINYKEENEEALMLQSKISENLKEEFGLPFGKYTDVKINGDTGVFSVRMADHSQRFANIRTNYSISLVIADKDATANNYGSNGFERKEIEAGEGNHAQIYINTDLTEKQAIEYAVSEVKEQIEFAKNEISFSLSETNIADPLIEKIQKLIRDPETKATVFKVMAMRMDKLKAKQNAKLTQRLFDGDGELSTNEELIDSLAQLDAIRAVLPKEIRGLIGGDKNLAELKTVKGRTNYLIRRMNRVDDVLESYMVKSYKESINKLFQRSKPKSKNKASDSGQSKIGSAGHLIAEAAEAASMMSPDAAELEAAKIRREIDKPEPEEEQVIQDRAYVTEMFADMGNADSHRLEQMLGILQANWDEGRAEWVKVLSDRKEWRENIIEKARKAFGVTKRNDSETTSKTGKTDAKWKQYAKEGLTFYHLTDLLKEGDTDEAASVWKELEDDFRRAENMNEDLNFKHKEEMKAVMSDIFGFTRNKQAQIQGRLRTLSKQVRQTKLTKTQEYELEIAANQVDLDQAEKAFDADQEITIRGVVISKKEFAELQIGWKDAVSMGFDPEARKLFRYSIVRNEGERTSVGEMSQLDMLKDYLCIQQKDLKAKYEKTGHDQQYRMELEEALDEDTKELGLWMQNKLKDDQDIEQALHRQEYGLAMKLINNYFPAIFEHGGKQSGTVLTMDGVEIGQSSKRPSSHKLRVNHNSRPKKQNALSVYNGNVMQRNFWQTHAEVMRKWAGVIRDKNTQDYILRSKGQTTLNLLNRWLNDTENQGADIAKAQIETDNLWRSLGQGMALGILGGRITTILKNVIASSNVALGTNFKDLMRGISPEIKGDVKELYESPTFQRRLKIGSTVANRYALESSPSGHLYTSTLKRAAEYPTQAINLADTLSNLTFALAYRAKIKNLQIETRGMTEADAKEKALDYVDSLVARYAQPTGRLSKSLWENTRGPEAMFLVKFMSEARKVIAINMLAIRKLSTGKGVGNKGDAGRQLLITIIVNSLFVHVINSLCSAFVKGEGEGEEPEDEFINRLTDGKSIAAAMMTESFSGVPIVSDGYRYAVNTTLGVKAYDSSSNPTMKIAKAGSTALSLLTDDKERTASEMADSIMRVVQGFGSITPYTAVFSQAANVGRDGLGFYNNTLGKGLNEEDTKQLSIDRISKKKKYIYGLDSELYTAGTKREKKQITETRHDALEVYLLDYLMDLPDNRRKLVIDELNDEKEIDKDVMKRVEKEIYSQ
tara:strand:+ start:61 stop:10641 length:10581 start_codon:yes stop_codon:yes gene_type:complete